MKRKSTAPASTPPLTSSSNACILCARSFTTSEEVQRHLLTEHMNKREEEQDTGKADEGIKVKEEVQEKVEEVVVEVKVVSILFPDLEARVTLQTQRIL